MEDGNDENKDSDQKEKLNNKYKIKKFKKLN
jgi:hypothetical protein